jgi:hypothetical protein
VRNSSVCQGDFRWTNTAQVYNILNCRRELWGRSPHGLLDEVGAAESTYVGPKGFVVEREVEGEREVEDEREVGFVPVVLTDQKTMDIRSWRRFDEVMASRSKRSREVVFFRN